MSMILAEPFIAALENWKEFTACVELIIACHDGLILLSSKLYTPVALKVRDHSLYILSQYPDTDVFLMKRLGPLLREFSIGDLPPKIRKCNFLVSRCHFKLD
jgi:hypothetical protein